jgi:pilus assembly protein Flp/PilA
LSDCGGPQIRKTGSMDEGRSGSACNVAPEACQPMVGAPSRGDSDGLARKADGKNEKPANQCPALTCSGTATHWPGVCVFTSSVWSCDHGLSIPLNLGELIVKKALWNVFKEEDGATALEYAILVVLIAIVFSAGAAVFGGALRALFTDTATSVNGVTPSTIAAPQT